MKIRGIRTLKHTIHERTAITFPLKLNITGCALYMNAGVHGSGFAAQQNRIVFCTVDVCSGL
jgi:hypothetical protein